MEKRKKNIKIIITVSVVISSLLIILALAAWLIPAIYSKISENESKEKKNAYYYYPVDYEEDIFSNPHYIGLDRSVRFGDESILVDYTVDTLSSAPEDGKLFIMYFDDVINGRCDELPKHFMPGYIGLPQKFTGQMIYDILVRKKNDITKAVIDGEETDVLNYYVSYKIYRNNGTFREGIRSDSSVPQIYQVYRTKDNTLKIYSILDIEYK